MTLPFFSGIVSVNQKLKELDSSKIKFQERYLFAEFRG